MIRSELIEKMELINPALEDDNLVAVFTNICFDKNVVYAYKDSLGIFAPIDNEDSFAIHGKTFFKMLSKLSGKEVELTRSDEEVLVVSGSSKMKLPFITKEEFMFEEPEEEEWDIIFDIDDTIINGIRLCMMTAADNAVMSGLMGVAIEGGKEVNLYSCNGDGMSQFKLSSRKAPDVRYIIPNEFCEALVRIAKKTKCTDGQLYVNGEWALAELANDYRIFGRVIINDEFDFTGNLERALETTEGFVEIPDGMLASLERARVIADQENSPTVISIKKGKMNILTDSHIGKVEDKLAVDKGHIERESSIAAKLISKAVSECTHFSLGKGCTIYKLGDDFTVFFTNYEG